MWQEIPGDEQRATQVPSVRVARDPKRGMNAATHGKGSAKCDKS
jgi:hypothetical protein